METSVPVELVRPVDLTDKAPDAYAAVAHGATRFVFTAGACPLDSYPDQLVEIEAIAAR